MNAHNVDEMIKPAAEAAATLKKNNNEDCSSQQRQQKLGVIILFDANVYTEFSLLAGWLVGSFVACDSYPPTLLSASPIPPSTTPPPPPPPPPSATLNLSSLVLLTLT